MTPDDLFQTLALPELPPFIEALVASYADLDMGDEALISLVGQHPDWSARAQALAHVAVAGTQPLGLDESREALGAHQLRNLVLLAALPDLLPAAGQAALPEFWAYTVSTACGARWLAQAVEEDGEQAFTLGLLHALGQPLMHAAWPQRMAELAQEACPLSPDRVRVEQQRLGLHHAEVSAELARRWGFAPAFSEPLGWVPSPLDAKRWATPAAIVHVAAWRVRVDLLGWHGEQAHASCPVELGRVLGVPFEWDPSQSTLISASDELMGNMPSPRELGAGLLSVLRP